MGRPVHHGGVEFDNAFLVRDAAVADRVIAEVGLDNRDSGDRGIQRIDPREQQFHRLFEGPQAVRA